ncbi:ScbR family autoregulator-binding transcription factor [Kitasatospora sp. NBC_01287]|uniref:ScbR family autoregulator-binding transcription factor n=1 Tax=Kitasatospora sp. NBC_01287 TaxID=2903573 RepID=UPI0022557393|nr:ScbR family autoregulator-binding transcription factor [Kitasatospora sp. NBC_01287]MCX4746063.1 ScbR family autoregulator-binding transcription factor [Kitasatospora sp. NBC_01287]
MNQTTSPPMPTTARTASIEQLLEPKQERALRTRSQILEASAELFAQHGYLGTSITDVARSVGMTKGAVYFHFKDKEDMAIAVVETHYQRWATLLDSVHGQGLDPLATIHELLDRAAHAFAEDAMVRAGTRLQAEQAQIKAELPRPYLAWIEKLASNLIASAQEAGQVRRDLEAAALARVIVSAFFGMQYVSDVLNSRDDLLTRWSEVRTVVLGALAPR